MNQTPETTTDQPGHPPEGVEKWGTEWSPLKDSDETSFIIIDWINQAKQDKYMLAKLKMVHTVCQTMHRVCV